MTSTLEKKMTVEEYIEFETTSELRHEYINGQLIEMPGEKKRNNKITGYLYAFFLLFLEERGYSIYVQSVKAAIPGEKKIYYPDLLLTAEPESEGGDYIAYKPELIVEVISKTSWTRDTVDKYIDYTKILSLKYYFIIDPVKNYITVHSKNNNGEWEAEAYDDNDDVIHLPLLQLELPLKTIFR